MKRGWVAARLTNLVARQRNERCPAELMRGTKLKPTIKEKSVFGSRYFVGKRDRDVSKHKPRSLEKKMSVQHMVTTDPSSTYTTRAKG